MEGILLPMQTLTISSTVFEDQRANHWRAVLNGPKPTRAWANRYVADRAIVKTKKTATNERTQMAKMAAFIKKWSKKKKSKTCKTASLRSWDEPVKGWTTMLL